MTWEALHRLRLGPALPDGRRSLDWRGPALVGVLNVTPDSFSDAGRHADAAEAVAAGLRLQAEGALIVDVGGESTRPGATGVDEREELRRVLGVVEALAGEGVVVSIDTRKPRVAAAALKAGAVIVNDVGGLTDPGMARVCADAGAPAIVVHMRGEPRTMQAAPEYRDVVGEVEAFLLGRAAAALQAGVPSVVLDPGIGFGKNVGHNVALLRATDRLAAHTHPLMVGASRKSFIRTVTGEEVPEARVPGSIGAHLWAAAHGAALLRVHDVAAHAQALAMWGAILAAVPGERRA